MQDGVYLVNAKAGGSRILRTDGSRVEYKFSDLVTETEKTEAEKDKEIVTRSRGRLEGRLKQLKLRDQKGIE